MNRQKNSFVTIGFVVSVSMIAVSIAVFLVSRYDGRIPFKQLDAVCGKMLRREPEAEELISAALKEYMEKKETGETESGALEAFGYSADDFVSVPDRNAALFAAIGFLAGNLLFVVTLWRRDQREERRIQALTEYLEQVNMGNAAALFVSGEDDFSKLKDELYKTVTYLGQTKDAAVQAKNAFAQNLSNIAHQIKTPITAISLSVQMMKRDFKADRLMQVEKQLQRLTKLEEALLVLSGIDAGTLLLQKEEVDVFTALTLAADHLQELCYDSGVSILIPELGETMIVADLDWTMEAFLNLMKNCMEHSRGGGVHCSYAKNALYTEILIWDDGEGFAEEDLPRLFERFYRGKNAKEGGIGIGLALAKELIENQNGTIRARNLPEGGALFEIRFYQP